MAGLFFPEKMKKYSIVSLLLFAFSASRASSQLLTLDSILDSIERNNPMFRMYDEQIAAMNTNAQMAKSWMPPRLSTGPWQTPYNSFRDGMWMISAEQMIPNPVKQEANYKYMLGMSAVEQQEKMARRNEMFSMAKRSYYEWIVLKKKYETLVQVDSLLAFAVQVARARYTYRKEKLSNIYKARADLYELRNMETMMLADMSMRTAEINTLMNRDRSIVFDIDTTVSLRDYELHSPDTLQIASARSDIRQFDVSIELIRLRQEYERSKRLPEFGITLNHMQSLGDMPAQYSIMGMITVPIVPWASGEYEFGIQGLDNSANAIRFHKQSMVNDIVGSIALLQIQMRSAKQQLMNYRNNIAPMYLKSYQASLLAYQQNTEDLFVVLDALKMYRMAMMDELEQLNFLLRLQVEYEKEMEIR